MPTGDSRLDAFASLFRSAAKEVFHLAPLGHVVEAELIADTAALERVIATTRAALSTSHQSTRTVTSERDSLRERLTQRAHVFVELVQRYRLEFAAVAAGGAVVSLVLLLCVTKCCACCRGGDRKKRADLEAIEQSLEAAKAAGWNGSAWEPAKVNNNNNNDNDNNSTSSADSNRQESSARLKLERELEEARERLRASTETLATLRSEVDSKNQVCPWYYFHRYQQ